MAGDKGAAIGALAGAAAGAALPVVGHALKEAYKKVTGSGRIRSGRKSPKTQQAPPPPAPPPPHPAARNGGGHKTGRAFLPTGQNEESGYGLYSYLLFGTQPTEGTRERYLAAIRAYVETIETVEKLRTQFSKRELNITYLPVTEEPASDKPPAEWLLDHYDFARAIKLLGAFPQAGGLGPYLFSTLEPASRLAAENKNVACPCLFQNLTTVEPSIMVLWIHEFKKQAEQEEFWRQDTRETAMLKLRNAIALGASALDATKKSAEEWTSLLASLVSWGEGKKDGR